MIVLSKTSCGRTSPPVLLIDVEVKAQGVPGAEGNDGPESVGLRPGNLEGYT
jgi:hypothetical protein